MDDTEAWDRERDVIRTSKGGFILGVDVRDHGVSLLRDLMGKHSWFEVTLLHVTGRMPEPRLAQWLENLFLSMSYPDSRIWCNQVAVLAGTLRTPAIASLCAGLLASDSLMYGSGAACRNALSAIDRIQARCGILTVHDSVELELKARPVIPGFSRPIVNGDERVAVLQQIAGNLGFPVGATEALVFDIDRATQSLTGERVNLLAYYVAFLRDQGLIDQDIMSLTALFTQSGIQACYTEAVGRPKEGFLPLRCEDVEYTGVAPRKLRPRIT